MADFPSGKSHDELIARTLLSASRTMTVYMTGLLLEMVTIWTSTDVRIVHVIEPIRCDLRRPDSSSECDWLSYDTYMLHFASAYFVVSVACFSTIFSSLLTKMDVAKSGQSPQQCSVNPIENWVGMPLWRLKQWIQEAGLSGRAVNAFLRYARQSGCMFPVDSRTLMGTPRSLQLRRVAPGWYGHFGLERALMTLPNIPQLTHAARVAIHVAIDGMSPFRSSRLTLWPIFGMVVDPVRTTPFLIGLYGGAEKPFDVCEYLRDLVEELSRLWQSGVRVSESKPPLQLQIRAVICDSPARAYVKCKPDPTGYDSCDKGRQHGVYQFKKVTYPDKCYQLWTDREFRLHHSDNPSPFMALPIDMIRDFPLDYMHLVCLGVCRKLICLWMHGKTGTSSASSSSIPPKYKLKPFTVLAVNDRMIVVRQYFKHIFPRLCQGWVDFKFWKACEYRQFLLYIGPVVLRSLLPDELYQNFMFLSIAVFVFCHETFHRKYFRFARSLMSLFVEDFKRIYGEGHMTFNVHGLTHLHEDVQYYGVLDNFSAFPFESHMAKLKRKLRSPAKPVVQLLNRLNELPVSAKLVENVCPRSTQNCPSVMIRGWVLTQQSPQNVFMANGSFYIVKSILDDDQDIVLESVMLPIVDDMWQKGVGSRVLGSAMVSATELGRFFIKPSEVQCKCILVHSIVKRSIKKSPEQSVF